MLAFKNITAVFKYDDAKQAFLTTPCGRLKTQGHHPDLHLTQYRNVEIRLQTHSKGGEGGMPCPTAAAALPKYELGLPSPVNQTKTFMPGSCARCCGVESEAIRLVYERGCCHGRTGMLSKSGVETGAR